MTSNFILAILSMIFVAGLPLVAKTFDTLLNNFEKNPKERNSKTLAH